MKALVPLPVPPSHLDRYVAIRDRKHHVTRSVLILNHAAVTARFADLAVRAAAGTLHSIPVSPLLGISRQLRQCYDSETKKLEELRKAIRDAQPAGQLKYCPYCGTTKGETDDHYMPAVRFPEFAVHPLNLVPACSRCNSTKGDDWLDAGGQRQFLHLFVDTVPATVFLEVDLVTVPTATSVGASFRLNRGAIATPVWQLIKSHFDRLKLIDYYDELGSDEIGEMIGSAKSYREAAGPDVRGFLNYEAGKAEGLYGLSHWRARLFRALAVHPDTDRLTQP